MYSDANDHAIASIMPDKCSDASSPTNWPGRMVWAVVADAIIIICIDSAEHAATTLATHVQDWTDKTRPVRVVEQYMALIATQ